MSRSPWQGDLDTQEKQDSMARSVTAGSAGTRTDRARGRRPCAAAGWVLGGKPAPRAATCPGRKAPFLPVKCPSRPKKITRPNSL
jgi:hypothetical protein